VNDAILCVGDGLFAIVIVLQILVWWMKQTHHVLYMLSWLGLFQLFQPMMSMFDGCLTSQRFFPRFFLLVPTYEISFFKNPIAILPIAPQSTSWWQMAMECFHCSSCSCA
jgi:hypothetical protein